MSLYDLLAACIARAGYVCPECGLGELTAVWDAGEPVPDSAHWADLATGYACPALEAGSPAMIRCWLDIWDALHAAGYPAADYGEDARQTMAVPA